MRDERGSLDPWRVLLHHLFQGDTSRLADVLDRGGLAVDWLLSSAENYSESTRKRALRPRIIASYEALSQEDQLRISHSVAQSFEAERREELERALEEIGWSTRLGDLAPTSSGVSELFFPAGTQHDAYVEIRRILASAKGSVDIVDPYIDETLLTLVGAAVPNTTSVRILTAHPHGDLVIEADKFRSQHAGVKLEIRKGNEFHDRFLVVDAGECWHLGASIKDAGLRTFMISRFEDQGNQLALLRQVAESWAIARIVSPLERTRGT